MPKEKTIGKGVRFERIRRITGYLTGDVSRFNNAKRAEEADRVKHSVPESTKQTDDQPPPVLSQPDPDRLAQLVLDSGALCHVYLLNPDDDRLGQGYASGREPIGTCCGHAVYTDKQSGDCFAPAQVEHAMYQANCAVSRFAYSTECVPGTTMDFEL